MGAFALSAAWRLASSLKSSKTLAAADAPLVAAVGVAGWAVYKKVPGGGPAVCGGFTRGSAGQALGEARPPSTQQPPRVRLRLTARVLQLLSN